ncbi:DUF721 domain-containing protein [Actinomyces haliotis]|uniref:DUF721 domain-containing protein n=1 Tax=Actinomyces haliotis TaxID=1280843 RepID=UPI002B272EDD|nr:DciA family protein [Actinomyces haliotis]
MAERPGDDLSASSSDVLASRALARERGHAWDSGKTMSALRRAATGEDGVAAWDAKHRRRSEDELLGPEEDRGPGLPPGRGRPGPSPFDPRPGGTDLRRYADEHGWAGKLAIASVSVRWSEIVGPQIAEHALIESFEVGRLTIRASSSSWAQQLRLLMPTIERAVTEELGGSAVEIRVLGPAGPTWRHGRFGAARGGRGPRDTYG